jgi:Ni,Fe-hydrogenase III large subunit/Ni,Fe-hydrogenase III component G
MRIHLLQKEMEKMNSGFTTEIKNINELYVMVEPAQVKDLVNTITTIYKFNFIAEFCRQEKEFIISVLLSNRREGYYIIISYRTQSELVSLQDIVYESHLFEREIADLFGVQIIDGKDIRNTVKHEPWPVDIYPLRKEFTHGEKVEEKNEIENYRFSEISGEGGYQIPVGPVHAGVIEPGHFRFSVIGEQIENLEIRLMYKHRGIEKLCENVEVNNLNLLFERVAGESSVAYSEVYALLIEKLLEYNAPQEIKALRVVLLELERIYNFLDDIAGICVDVGFSYPAKKFGYFSEQIHQLCERLTGSRFLRNTIIPCGINIDFNKMQADDILITLNSIKKRMNSLIEATLGSVSFLDRVENTGLVFSNKARRLCMTGVVGRASGIRYDVRHNFKYEIYEDIKKNVNIETLGGVFERYKLKIAEIRDAFEFIERALALINRDIPKNRVKINLEEGKEALSAVETVKGELVVYGKVGKNNKFERVYFKTPSFTNWDGLTYAVLNEIVPDFPLCNKSFNMSYSENDR